MPLVETVMIARPTSNSSLYTQMVGRGLRLYPGKEKLTLIDLVGTTGRANLCTAPSLLGIDMEAVPESKRDEIQGDLFELPDLITKKADCPASWIRNIEIVNLWAKEQQYNTHAVNYFKMPNGNMVCSLKGAKIIIPAQDEVGKTIWKGQKVSMQKAFDEAYLYLQENYADQEFIWNINKMRGWGSYPASEKQINSIKRFMKNFDTEDLTKLQATQILNRLFYR